MRYDECLEYLDRLGARVPVVKSGLDNMRRILEAHGNPQRSYPSVLIAGTNGKGSVAAFLSSILTVVGLRTGLYTSPHLTNIEERIAIDGQRVSPEAFARCVTPVVDTIRQLNFPCHPTFFETVTAAAFLHFARVKVDIAVVEAGLGGRTDSTNVLEPVLSVITPISIDHQQYLGETIEEIAYQKAGIIPWLGKAISAPQKPEVRSVLEQETARRGAVISVVDEAAAVVTDCIDGRYRFSFDSLEFELTLYGRHQVGNAVLAVSAARLLKDNGYPISSQSLTEGVARAFIPGRIQKISGSPAVFLDGAHNDAALTKLADFVSEHTRGPRSLVFALMADKRISSSIDRLAGCFDAIYLTHPSSKRSASHDQLHRYFPTGIWFENPMEAFELAKQHSETVVVAGSLYLVGEVLAFYRGRTPQSPMPRPPIPQP